jgi:DNA-binding transcriptional LysR family regulator
MDKINAAKVFIDVAHSLSFSATAQRLNMSRPTVTRHIETMEDWLNIRLLNRTTRNMSLTTAGNACLKDVKAWISKADSLSSLVTSGEELSGSIRITTTMSFSYSQLVPALVEFMKVHPKVTIDLDVQENVVDLSDQRIDLAIRISENPDPALITKSIATCESVLVASSQYVLENSAIENSTDLSKHDCLGYGRFEPSNWYLSSGDHFNLSHVKCRFTANEATSLLHATLNGGGISLLPTYLVNSYIEDGLLEVLLPDLKPTDLTIYAAYSSKKHLLPEIRELITHLEVYFQKQSW